MLRRFFASTVLLGAVVYLLLHVSLPWTMMMYIYGAPFGGCLLVDGVLVVV